METSNNLYNLIHSLCVYIHIFTYINIIYKDVQFTLLLHSITSQLHTHFSHPGLVPTFGGGFFLICCFEALCKLQSVLVPLTLAIGVLPNRIAMDVSFDTKSTISQDFFRMLQVFFGNVLELTEVADEFGLKF